MSHEYAQLFRALLPETALVVGAVLVLMVDIALFRRRSDAARLNIASAASLTATNAPSPLTTMAGSGLKSKAADFRASSVRAAAELSIGRFI